MKVDCQNPGSDLVGETAASLASASILFKGEDDTYSELLLDHAKKLYKFADTCRGKYSDSIHDANTFYKYVIRPLFILFRLEGSLLCIVLCSIPIFFL